MFHRIPSGLVLVVLLLHHLGSLLLLLLPLQEGHLGHLGHLGLLHPLDCLGILGKSITNCNKWNSEPPIYSFLCMSWKAKPSGLLFPRSSGHWPKLQWNYSEGVKRNLHKLWTLSREQELIFVRFWLGLPNIFTATFQMSCSTDNKWVGGGAKSVMDNVHNYGDSPIWCHPLNR